MIPVTANRCLHSDTLSFLTLNEANAAMLMALTHLSASPQDQAIIQPLVLSLLHWCRKVVSSLPEPGLSRGDFLSEHL
jgi:hypothetical protein